MWLELLREFFYDLNAHRTRAILTLVAITWGTIAVVLLLSFGEGLTDRLTDGLINAGNRIMIVYPGETGLSFEGLPKGRRVRMVEEDVNMLRQTIPAIETASPQYRTNMTLTYKKLSMTTECEGVNAEFEEMRRMYPAGGGRFLNALDVAQERRVIFLGAKIAKDIFNDEYPVGKVLFADGVPFTVVGIMQEKLQTSMNNGPDDRRAIIPYTSFRTMYGNQYVNSIVVRPSDPGKQKMVKSELYRVLGRKYRFDPSDERALGIWDFIEDEAINRKVGLGISIFFRPGWLPHVVDRRRRCRQRDVCRRQRTDKRDRHQNGDRRQKRYILFQFVFEALLISFLGGFIGMMFSWGVVSLVRTIPADDGPMQFLGRPILSLNIMLLTAGILALIGVL